MSDVLLPQPADLLLPTLLAVTDGVEGEGSYQEIDAYALEYAGITEAQKAVVFDDSSSASGPKILHRLAWARSMLKRIGALESASHGRWAATEWGHELGFLDEDEARAEIDRAVAQAYETVEPSAEQMAEFRQKAQQGEPASMSIRELIMMWGAGRRRATVIKRINSALKANALTTEPDFTVGGLDSSVRIVGEKPAELSDAAEPKTEQAVSLVVGNIPSATTGVTSVSPQSDLITAQSEMQAHDFSQLAVLNGPYNLAGAISWESIAKVLLVNRHAELAECIDPNPVVVRVDQPLLDAVPAIADAGYVFVRGTHNKIVGIVTVADLSEQFAILTRPFLLIGEIERLLRSAVDRCFSSDQLYEFLDPDDDREVEGAHSLSLGEVQRLIEIPTNFDALEWHAARKVFIRKLDRVRLVRNDVMHFSPDPIPDDDMTLLRTFADWVRQLQDHTSGTH